VDFEARQRLALCLLWRVRIPEDLADEALAELCQAERDGRPPFAARLDPDLPAEKQRAQLYQAFAATLTGSKRWRARSIATALAALEGGRIDASQAPPDFIAFARELEQLGLGHLSPERIRKLL